LIMAGKVRVASLTVVAAMIIVGWNARIDSDSSYLLLLLLCIQLALWTIHFLKQLNAGLGRE
jgi:hypothetical protein